MTNSKNAAAAVSHAFVPPSWGFGGSGCGFGSLAELSRSEAVSDGAMLAPEIKDATVLASIGLDQLAEVQILMSRADVPEMSRCSRQG